MAEKEYLIKEKFDHSGIFDFKGFYSYAYSWFQDEGYGVIEDKYSEKVSGNSRDIKVDWSTSRKLSDYFQIEMRIKFEVSGLTDVEVEIDNQRKQMNKGKISVEVKALLNKDPESKWDANPVTRFLRDLYDKYVIPKRVYDMRNTVIEDVTSFKEELKAYLEVMGRRQLSTVK